MSMWFSNQSMDPALVELLGDPVAALLGLER